MLAIRHTCEKNKPVNVEFDDRDKKRWEMIMVGKGCDMVRTGAYVAAATSYYFATYFRTMVRRLTGTPIFTKVHMRLR